MVVLLYVHGELCRLPCGSCDRLQGPGFLNWINGRKRAGLWLALEYFS